ncbi:hypothetical protein BKA62DRAFT_717854 [Auriculariales sp. MPI-PUGE-AT-0066]|nr:hypothetical protein BKA62DRAFT_717854 [Auriculariales sp. MPI-PUGE-AT-0066]
MSTPAPSILILGVTGYVGGAVLVNAIKAFPTSQISVLVRHDKHDAAIKATGVASVLHGDTDNVEALHDIFSKFDVVINVAPDDNALVDAIIVGLKTHKERTGKRAVYVHTTGGLVVADAAQGAWDPNFKYISDLDTAALQAVPPTAFHRSTELKVLEADAAKDIYGYLVCPGWVWGISPGPVRKDSINMLQTFASVFGKGLYIGQGTNLFAMVHVEDVAELVVLILRRALSGVDAEVSSYKKYYFAATREEQQKDIAVAVVKGMVQLGKLDTDELKSVSVEEVSKLQQFAFILGVNAVFHAKRGKAIGWNPSRLGSSLENIADQLRPIVDA